MEINITKFFQSVNASDLSASVMEKGADAGQITWNNSLKAAEETVLLDTDEKLQAFREWVKPWGGWTDEEIAAWDAQECNALFLQWIASDMREASLDKAEPDWEQYEKDSAAGQCPSSIFKAEDGTIYFTLSH